MSLAALMNEWTALMSTVHPDLRVYRWRPATVELPAIYNWMGDSPREQRDLTRFRDRVQLLTRLAVDLTSSIDEEMDTPEVYVDAFRARVDDAIHNNRPLAGAATSVRRTGMRTVLDTFNEVDVLCFEFMFDVWLDDHHTPE